MKIIGKKCLILSIISFTLGGCLGTPTISKQATALNTDCAIDNIEISDEVIELNNEQYWTATCNGKMYKCTYHDTGGSDCYELHEPKKL